MANDNFTPHGYRTVTPYFTVKDPEKMIQFVKTVFDAEELNRSINAEGRMIHAEVLIGDTIVEVSEGTDRFPPRPNTLHVFVSDTDECYRRALEAGAASLYDAADMPYGERSAGVADPFGNHWYIATFKGKAGQGYYR
ncbi:VOC family protein [Brevibacillus sp. B_LB10_24]|uniref:VOC family protein n=1 Tax=Brevibacillus sp. B_LB10_24 TaxID=3380645 RepID=UPI0038B72327